MNIKEKKLESRVELWALIGPFIMIITLIILLIKPVQHPLYIPLAALIGIPVCWRWKLPGLAIALGILGALVAYQMSNESNDKAAVWDFTLGIAVALSFCVTALSYKEVQEVILHLQKESSSRLQNFLHVDEKIKSLEHKRDADQSTYVAKIDLISQQLAERTAQLQSYEQLVDLAREELLHATREHERLLQESFQKRNECELAKERLEDAEILIKNLNEQLSAKTTETQENKPPDYDIEVRHQAVVHEMNEYIETINREKQLLETTLKSLQTEVDTLRSVVEQKDLFLQENAGNIRSLKELASLNERELIEYRKKSDELIEAYSKKELSLSEQLKQIEVEYSQLFQETDHLRQKSKALEANTDILAREKDALTNHLESVRRECDAFKSELSLKLEELLKETHALQRAKGMYGQLRDQFDEKGLELEKTRKELFLTSEVLLKCQHELEEERLYGTEEYTLPSSFSYMLKLDKEIQNMEQRHAEETDALHDLVHHLINENQTAASKSTPKKTSKKAAVKEEILQKTEIVSKAEPKPKKSKSTKTTAWANTILSRWSSFEEQA